MAHLVQIQGGLYQVERVFSPSGGIAELVQAQAMEQLTGRRPLTWGADVLYNGGGDTPSGRKEVL